MKLTIKDINGNDQGDLDVGFTLVEDGKGQQAVHDVVTAYRAAQRSGTAKTKTMGEVSHSQKKPWRQKGTGRARTSSTVGTQWKGGGVPHGPKPRDYTKKVTAKTRRLALRKALTERLNAGDVLVVDDLALPDHKTKGFIAVQGKLGIKGSTLVVVAEPNDNLRRATSNLQKVDVASGSELNTYQVLLPDKLLFTKSGFEQVGNRLKD